MTGYVVCADTEAEAWRYHDHYVDDLGDFEAAENLINELVSNACRSWPEEAFKGALRSMVAGWGTIPLVGMPEMIADELVQLGDVGVDGIGLGWVDYTAGVA